MRSVAVGICFTLCSHLLLAYCPLLKTQRRQTEWLSSTYLEMGRRLPTLAMSFGIYILIGIHIYFGLTLRFVFCFFPVTGLSLVPCLCWASTLPGLYLQPCLLSRLIQDLAKLPKQYGTCDPPASDSQVTGIYRFTQSRIAFLFRLQLFPIRHSLIFFYYFK